MKNLNIIGALLLAVIGLWPCASTAQNNPSLNAPLSSKYGLFQSATTNNVWPLTLTNNETRTFASTNKIAVQRDRGMAFFCAFSMQTNATVTNITVKLDVSYDGTNWSTSAPVTWTPTSNGTNTVIAYTNVMRDTLDNYRYLRLTSIAAPTNAIVNSVYWSSVP